MTCGHRGKPNRMEEKRISRLLRKSGFIPMLEEIYLKKPQQKDDSKTKTPIREEENSKSKDSKKSQNLINKSMSRQENSSSSNTDTKLRREFRVNNMDTQSDDEL
jgi:hypothetical protein